MTQAIDTLVAEIEADEEEYVMTWTEDQDYFVDGIGVILADTEHGEGFDELRANYMNDGTELDWGEMTPVAEKCYYDIFDEVNRRLEPTAEMLEIGTDANDEYVDAFDEQLCLYLSYCM